MKKSKIYTDGLTKRLSDKDYATEYLNAVLEMGGTDLLENFLLALRDVAKAHRIADIAENANLTRNSLYKALSENGNPSLGTIIAILRSIGIKLRVESEEAS